MKNIYNKALPILAIVTFLFGGSQVAFAQQNFQLSQYMNGAMIYNPAFAGIEDQTEAILGTRSQWFNWNGLGAAPTTTFFTASARLPLSRATTNLSMPLHTSDESGELMNNTTEKSSNNSGVGIYVYTDKYAYFNRLTGGFSYASHFKLENGLNISVGASLGITNNALDETMLTAYDETNDDSYNALVGANQNRTSLDLNFGGLLYTQQFFVGYSANQITRGKQFASSTGLEESFKVHHYILAGYNLEMSDDLNFTPSIIIQTLSASPVTVDFTGKFLYKKKYWGGVSIRNEDAFIVFAGLKASDNLSLSYSYDINTSEIKNHSNGGHEITLGAYLGKPDQEVRNDFLWQ